MDTLIRRVDITRLYPPFAALWLEVISNCHDRGVDYFAISGFRDATEQASLYAQGRKTLSDGTWIVSDSQKVITNARPMYSAHQYGIAGDVCRDKDVDRAGLQPGWSKADYEVYAVECAAVGLEAGLRWIPFADAPHAQLPLEKRGIGMARLKLLYERGGMPAVYELLDQFRWGKQ